MDKSTICFLLAIVMVFAAGIWIAHHESAVSVENYNDGVCTECGGHYQFSSAVHVKNSGDRYYYTCDDCGHTVMTFKLMR